MSERIIVGDTVRLTRDMGDLKAGTELRVTHVAANGDITAVHADGRSVMGPPGYRIEFVRRPRFITQEIVVLVFLAVCAAAGLWQLVSWISR